MMNKLSPSPACNKDEAVGAMFKEKTSSHDQHYGCPGDFWTSLSSYIVYNSREGLDGSLPRDVYEDNQEYKKRSALHAEVIGPLRALLMLEIGERGRLNNESLRTVQLSTVEQCRRHLERAKFINAIMAAHRLTDSAD
jgi:hypothetical protein